MNSGKEPRTGISIHRYASGAAKAVAITLFLSVLVLVAWNMFAPDLFDLPRAQFKQSLGIVVFVSVFVSMRGIPRRHSVLK